MTNSDTTSYVEAMKIHHGQNLLPGDPPEVKPRYPGWDKVDPSLFVYSGDLLERFVNGFRRKIQPVSQK